MQALVVGINPQGQRAHRHFWGGPIGSALLLVPGAVITILGVVLLIRDPVGASLFFALVVVFSGLYGVYAGWDHRRRTQRRNDEAPLAFAMDAEGVVIPRGKRYPWARARFIVTAEAEPRLLCSPAGLAYRVDLLDTDLTTIASAIEEFSDGSNTLERL